MKLEGKLMVCNCSALFATYLKTEQVIVDLSLKDVFEKSFSTYSTIHPFTITASR